MPSSMGLPMHWGRGKVCLAESCLLCRDRQVEPLRNIPKLKIHRGEARPDLRTLFWQRPVELGFQLGTLGELSASGRL